jgi:CubicO group peptidase (beta-lactamase class C family)
LFPGNYADFHSHINRLGGLLALNTSIDEFVASLKNIREPGTYNQYVSMDTQVLGYGYQWWIPENPEGDFLAVGVDSQYIYVHPAHGLVTAKSSAYAAYKKDGKDKVLQTIEMFRAIFRSITVGEIANAK